MNMEPKDIAKMLLDNSEDILKTVFEADGQVIKIMQNVINSQMCIIWQALIEKGIVTLEEVEKYQKQVSEIFETHFR